MRPAAASARLSAFAALLPDSPDVYLRWKELVFSHEVKGVQVHDAKLVALMLIHQLTHLLTLNPSDFSRYPSVTAVTPEQVIASANVP